MEESTAGHKGARANSPRSFRKSSGVGQNVFGWKNQALNEYVFTPFRQEGSGRLTPYFFIVYSLLLMFLYCMGGSPQNVELTWTCRGWVEQSTLPHQASELPGAFNHAPRAGPWVTDLKWNPVFFLSFSL